MSADRTDRQTAAIPFQAMTSGAIRGRTHKAVFQWWAQLRGERRMPARDDYRAEEIAAWRPNIELVEVVRAEPALRFRVIASGDLFVKLNGEDLTGRFLNDSLSWHWRDTAVALHSLAVEHRRPVYSLRHTAGRDGARYAFEKLVLPFASDGERPDHLMSCMAVEAPEAADLKGLQRLEGDDLGYLVRAVISP